MKAYGPWALELCLTLWAAQQARADPIPDPTGCYNVGRSRHLVEFVNRDDPTSPSNVSTEYLVTLYYPTKDEPADEPQPYLEPELSKMYADLWAFNTSHLTSNIIWDASYLDEPAGPTILFGPGGWGPPTDGYAIVLSELASRGYAVAAVDHIHEQPFLRLPDGTGVDGLALDFNPPLSYIVALASVRDREMIHLAGHLPALAEELGAPLDTTTIGAFGHSLGGSTAINALIGSDAVAAAINMDGTNFNRGNSTSPADDAGKPSMMLAFDGHTPDVDSSWANFFSIQTGWQRLFMATGTAHLDWSDAAYWKKWGSTRPLGPLDGSRVVEIQRQYVTAFFDEHLLGKGEGFLDGPSEDFPEVNLLYSHDP